MKTLFLLLVTSLFTLVNAQDGVKIPLQEFVLEIPTVNALVIKPLGAPKMAYFGDTTQMILVQDIYYQLVRADGRTIEHGNKTIPMQMYHLVYRFVDGTVTPSDISTINYFFQLADWPLTAILPE